MSVRLIVRLVSIIICVSIVLIAVIVIGLIGRPTIITAISSVSVVLIVGSAPIARVGTLPMVSSGGRGSPRVVVNGERVVQRIVFVEIDSVVPLIGRNDGHSRRLRARTQRQFR